MLSAWALEPGQDPQTLLEATRRFLLLFLALSATVLWGAHVVPLAARNGQFSVGTGLATISFSSRDTRATSGDLQHGTSKVLEWKLHWLSH